MLRIIKKEGEKRLLDIIGKLKDETDYTVIHFRFSQLFDHYKNEYQHKISINVINDILVDAEGYVIAASDYDIFVICRNVVRPVIKKMIFQLRYLYMDDPLAYDTEGNENPEFYESFELKNSWRQIFNLARDKAAELQKQKDKAARVRKDVGDPYELTPERLSRVEAELGKINIAEAFRSQPICAAKSAGFQPVLNEMYINIAALSELTASHVNLTSNRWLFRYLTELLDIKMLEHVNKNSRRIMSSAVSMNLNIETILSANFAEFDRNLASAAKKNVVLEIQASDVLGDVGGFLAARDHAQELGYRICIDGLTALTIRQIDRQSLGFDLAKMFWPADVKSDARTRDGSQLREAIERCGKSRIILARCDAADAVYYGQALGISLFQGRYVDSIVNPDSEIVN
jgi:hypothetical protein